MRPGLRCFLALPGLALLALDFAGLHALREDDLPGFIAAALAQGAVYLLAAWWVSSGRPAPLALVLLFAALLRLPLLFAPPQLSTDVYRYVWDGRVQAAGINPYRFVPAAPELQRMRDESIYPHINRRDYAVTIYPPAAQLFFLAVTRVSESVTWMKASILAWEGLLVWLLMLLLRKAGRPAGLALLYAWHPLPIWEFAGSGHLDAAAIAFILAALLARERGRPALAGLFLGLSALFKIYPLVLFPALWRPRGFRMPAALAAIVALAYLPYLGVGPGVLGFLPQYVREEGLVSGTRYYLLQVINTLCGAEINPMFYLLAAGLFMLVLAAWITLRPRPERNPAADCLLLAVAAVVVLPPHYAWYFAWLLPLSALTVCTPVLLLGISSFLLYLSLLVESAETALQTGHLLYCPFALLLVVEVWRNSRRETDAGQKPAP